MRAIIVAAAALLCAASGTVKNTVIGGRVYAFPPAAFMDGEVETGRVGDILIELAWPEMRPLTSQEAFAWPKRDTVRVLAISGAPVAGDAVPESALLADMPKMVAIARNLSVAAVEGAPGHIPPPRLDPNPVPSGNAVPGNGMERVEAQEFSPDSIKDDVFVPEPLTQPARFISCNRPDGFVVNPGCAEQFVAFNLAFKISYRRALVPQWREIEARTVEFFRVYEVHP